jgi:putative peptidoglycan lipid II flippase
MLRSFVTVSGISGLSLGIGLLQNIAIAGVFGATASKDAYDIASYLPRMMLFLFGLDLFKGISTSLFSRLDINKSEDPSKVFSTLVNGVILVSLFAIVVSEVFAKPLVGIIGKGLAPETSQLAVNLTRLLIPTLGLIAVTSLIGSIMLAHHYYGLSEGLAILPKLAMLIGALVWGGKLGIWVLVYAMIFGLSAELPFMLYPLHRSGLKYSLILRVNSPAIKSALIDAVPLGIGTIAIYLAGVVLQQTVSYGEAGTVACFNYALLLSGTLITLVCQPASTVLAPRVTRTLEAQDYESSSSMLGKSLAMVILICLAGISLVWNEASIIVDIVFGRGRFTSKAVEQTSGFLAIIFMGVLGVGIRMLAIGVLLARRRSKTIMIYCLISSGICALLAAEGRYWWGVYAAPIAYVGQTFVNGLLCIISAIRIVKLNQKMGNQATMAWWVIACLIVVVLPVIPRLLWPIRYTEPFFTKFLYLGVVCTVAGLSFILSAWLVGLYTKERILGLFLRVVGR